MLHETNQIQYRSEEEHLCEFSRPSSENSTKRELKIERLERRKRKSNFIYQSRAAKHSSILHVNVMLCIEARRKMSVTGSCEKLCKPSRSVC